MPSRKPSTKHEKPSKNEPFRAGTALLLGRPNAGKSTLLNKLVGEHIAIVSSHPQTTRHRIVGVVSRENGQLCLVDAPGVHAAEGPLNRAMVDQAMHAVADSDVILYLAEAGWPEKHDPAAGEIDPVGPFHRQLLGRVMHAGHPVVLVLTKIDLIPKPLLLPLIDTWQKAANFAVIYPLSGKTGENLDGFFDAIRPLLPEGEPLFDADAITDQSERALAAEYIREFVFAETRDEIPYGCAVIIEEFDEKERPPETPETKKNSRTGLFPGLVRIEATIIVSRENHKGMVIGKKGEKLKTIGTGARKRIEHMLGCRCWLGLHVKVVPDWSAEKSLVKEYGNPGSSST